MNAILFSGVAIMAMSGAAAATPVVSQQGAPTARRATAAPAERTAPTADAAATVATPADPQAKTDDAAGLGDIIVTAQRRSERLQDVPISITAADANTLAQARVENISNISTISPSIAFRSTNISSSTANVIIRGLGTTGNSRSFEGAVGIFIDGVYRTRAASALQNFLDIDSVQVLRGPQGTLFGKNTSAGAVLLSSTKPDVNEVAGRYEASYGNYDTHLVKGAVNVPLVAGVAALRVAGLQSQGAGYLHDVNTDRDINRLKSQAYKAQLLVEPSDGYSLQIIGDYSKSTGNCCYGTVNYVNGPTQPLVDALALARGQKLPSADIDDRETGLSSPTRQRIEDFGGTALFSADLGGGTVKSVTALRRFTLRQFRADADFSPADIFELNETFKSQFFSQELTYNRRLEGLRADIVLGGFFSDEDLDMTRDLIWGTQAQPYFNALLGALGLPAGTGAAPAGLWSSEVMGGKARSYAAFGHVDAAISGTINLIGGLRYSIEEKDGRWANSFFTPLPNAVFRILGVAPGPAYDRSTTNRALSGTAGIQYRPATDTMFYLTYNRGFKAGGVNIDSNGAGTRVNNPAEVPGGVPLSPLFTPEKVNAVELGGKVQYLNRRARTNIAFFYNDISNLQVAQFVGLRFTVLNANSAETYGAEIENLFEVADGITLSADATYLPHAKYGNDVQLGDALSGQRFRYAPKLAANAAINVDRPVSGDIALTGRVQYQYTSAQDIDTAAATRFGDVSLVNANLGIKSTRLGVQLEGWILNAFDKTYPTVSFATPLQTGDSNAYLGRPRTYGITLRGSF